MNPDTGHAAVNELLPWYVNGTASDDERRAVERHLEACAECQADLAWLRELGDVAGELAAGIPARADGFARTLSRIDNLESTTASGDRTGLVAWIASVFGPSPPALRWALAAQFAAIVALGGLLLVRAPADPGTTLSGSTSAAGGVRVTVVFEPHAPEERVREVLLQAQATVVAGPSALGVYTVELPVAGDDDPAVDAAVARLRAQSAVVRFAEREP